MIANIPAPTLKNACWTDLNATTFKTRGLTYISDKIKEPSATSIFKLIAIDVSKSIRYYPSN